MAWTDVNNTGESKDKLEYVKIEPGTSVLLRIVDEEPISNWTHWIPASSRSVVCRGKDCVVCDTIRKQKDAGEKPNYSSIMRHTIHVINKTTGRLEILEQGKTFFNQLLDFMKEVGDLRDYDIKVMRKGTKTDTTYTLIPMPKSELTNDEKAMLENRTDLKKMLEPLTNEQISMLMRGEDISDTFKSSDDDEDVEVEE